MHRLMSTYNITANLIYCCGIKLHVDEPLFSTDEPLSVEEQWFCHINGIKTSDFGATFSQTSLPLEQMQLSQSITNP